MEAITLGRHVALANKETLVAAGSIVVPEAARRGVRLLPLDSEHAALWLALSGMLSPGQCPPLMLPGSVSRVVLTASGGPFRTTPTDEMERAGPDRALRHPTWSMGAKVTIDSASLMNKALEVIEAHWLFGAPADRISVSVHPQSIIHAMVELVDGSVVAQMASPDMRLPIQQALTYPARLPSLAPPIAWQAPARLDLEPPDTRKFGALALATRVINAGGCAGAVMNAANEIAVEAFLAGHIPFGRITTLVEETMDRVAHRTIGSIEDVFAADHDARTIAAERLGQPSGSLAHR
jgi:1-deoxy-D-xylulose-5-phosphate reductoisomerase